MIGRFYVFRLRGTDLFAWQAVEFENRPHGGYTGCPIFFSEMQKGIEDPESLLHPSFAHPVICPEKWVAQWMERNKEFLTLEPVLIEWKEVKRSR